VINANLVKIEQLLKLHRFFHCQRLALEVLGHCNITDSIRSVLYLVISICYQEKGQVEDPISGYPVLAITHLLNGCTSPSMTRTEYFNMMTCINAFERVQVNLQLMRNSRIGVPSDITLGAVEEYPIPVNNPASSTTESTENFEERLRRIDDSLITGFQNAFIELALQMLECARSELEIVQLKLLDPITTPLASSQSAQIGGEHEEVNSRNDWKAQTRGKFGGNEKIHAIDDYEHNEFNASMMREEMANAGVKSVRGRVNMKRVESEGEKLESTPKRIRN
jgi:hypothetical protein